MHLYLSSDVQIESEIIWDNDFELNLSGFSLTFLTKYKNNRASSKSLLLAMGDSKQQNICLLWDIKTVKRIKNTKRNKHQNYLIDGETYSCYWILGKVSDDRDKILEKADILEKLLLIETKFQEMLIFLKNCYWTSWYSEKKLLLIMLVLNKIAFHN